jgi:hypothetical protein
MSPRSVVLKVARNNVEPNILRPADEDRNQWGSWRLLFRHCYSKGTSAPHWQSMGCVVSVGQQMAAVLV